MDTIAPLRASAERADPANTGVSLDTLFGSGTPKKRDDTRRIKALQDVAYEKLEAEWPYHRFTQNEWPTWGGWLTSRLNEKFPGIPMNSWLGRLLPYMASNCAFFAFNDSAILLATAAPRVPDGREVVIEAFGLSRYAEKRSDGTIAIPHLDHEKEVHLLSLYRHVREWSRRRRAHRLFIAIHSDMTGNRLQECLQAKHCGWVGFPL